MPRYFFNVHDGQSELDTEGTELTSHDAAQLAAVQLTGEILQDEPHRQKLGEVWHLDVLDEAGATICSVDVRVSAPPRTVKTGEPPVREFAASSS